MVSHSVQPEAPDSDDVPCRAGSHSCAESCGDMVWVRYRGNGVSVAGGLLALEDGDADSEHDDKGGDSSDGGGVAGDAFTEKYDTHY